MVQTFQAHTVPRQRQAHRFQQILKGKLSKKVIFSTNSLAGITNFAAKLRRKASF